MDRRYSRSEKGKGLATAGVPAKKPPVRILATQDNETLVEANRLSLIGRLTNTTVQKPRAVIDFMIQVWNLEGRVTGRTQGLDKFQISFESEHDLTQVLNKGPYHYKRWMLILQRWEPVVSALLPSIISFPVRIHGIPLQYWDEKVILTIGGELGKCSLLNEKEAKIWVEINGLEPLIMKMEVALPSEEITEVEFEYIRIEKHCFTCFSLFHEESDCPSRPRDALPPKQRTLGITQQIALQRIEAEKKRHDERRGYRRPEYPRSSYRQEQDTSTEYRMDSSVNRNHHPRSDSNHRERSILSRTARSNSGYHRNKTNSMQYRVVEKSRFSAGSSVPQFTPHTEPQRDPHYTGIIPNDHRDVPPAIVPKDTTPARTIQDRLGSARRSSDGSTTGSRERRPALERLSASRASADLPSRVSPTFESGRLQRPEEAITTDAMEVQHNSTERLPATSRLGPTAAGISRGRTIPIDPLSKVAGKKRITRAQARKRSPVQGLNLRSSSSGSSLSRRKQRTEKETTLPCNKAGTSSKHNTTKNRVPKTVFIPGITRGGVDFRPLPNSLP